MVYIIITNVLMTSFNVILCCLILFLVEATLYEKQK